MSFIVNYIKNIIRKLFVLLGVYPPAKIPNYKSFQKWKNTPAIDLKKRNLEVIVSYIKLKKNHEYYNLILRSYIPNFEPSYEKAKFVGFGVGKENLNCYRKIISATGQALFEKVYYSDNNKLESLLWLEKNIYFSDEDEIIKPEIKSVHAGDFLTAVYFKYLDITHLHNSDFERILNKVALSLYLKSNREKYKEVVFPDYFKNYKSHNYYENNIEKASAKLSGTLDLVQYTKKVDASFCVISHGDLSESNVCQNEIVIDWDSCGFFPLGLDIAKIYFRLIANMRYDVNYIAWLEDNYKENIKPKHWQDLLQNFTYFLFIFIQDASLKRTEKLNQLEASLLKELSQQEINE